MRFIDLQNRAWSVAIDVEAAMRLHRLLGLDLLSAGWAEWFHEEPSRFVDVAYVVCMPQADSRGAVSDLAFGRACRGEVIHHVADAVSEAVREFLPEPTEAPEPIPGETPRPDKAQGDPPTWAKLFEVAGAIGVDPRPFTLRQMMWMAEGRSKAGGRR